jgi:putative phosphoesterase
VETYANISASFAWTRGFVSATGWFDWLAQLPLEIRETIDGMHLLAVHAAPGTDDGIGIHPSQGNAELAAILHGCEADVVIVGHTHEAMLRRIGSVALVNLGSVSNPRSGDRRASYAILEVARDGVFVEHRRVAYDHDAFSAQVRASRHPATDFILSHQRGEVLARPRHPDHVEPSPGIRVAIR